MASVTSICNAALLKIGETTITHIEEGSDKSNACGVIYEAARDDLLRAHQWNFAVARVKLGRTEADPAFGLTYQFQMPADWIRTIDVFSDSEAEYRPEYRIEGRLVLSDATDIYLHYITLVTDANIMTPDFRQLLSLRIAADLAIIISASNTRARELRDEYDVRLARVRSVDAIEDWPERIPEGSWVTERWRSHAAR